MGALDGCASAAADRAPMPLHPRAMRPALPTNSGFGWLGSKLRDEELRHVPLPRLGSLFQVASA
jgi:hypothetical protein